MKIHIYAIVFLTALLPAIGIRADVTERDDGFTHHRAAINGSLTSVDTWQLDFSYHYRFCKYFAAGLGIGSWKQYFYDGFPSGNNWMIDSDDAKLSNFRSKTFRYSDITYNLKNTRCRFRHHGRTGDDDMHPI